MTKAQFLAIAGNILDDSAADASVLPSELLGLLEKAIDYADQQISAIPAPYKVLMATLSQSGTDAPVIAILQNTLGYVPSLSYGDVGSFVIGMTGLSASKVQVILSPKTTATKTLIWSYSITGNNINIKTYNLNTSEFENSMLGVTPIEIRIYL